MVLSVQIDNLGTVTFVKSSRARYQRITVGPDKTVTVTIARNSNLKDAKWFLESKIPWIKKQFKKIDQHVQTKYTPDLDIDLKEAQIYLFKRLDYFSKKYNLPYNQAAFRCQKTLWGSCSAKNNISLNINLAFLPAECQDYIILHELVHTKVKNHSRFFWSELDKYTDNRARELAKQLQRYNIRSIEY